ncbi:hypothetical protein LGK95_03830 [Clostridium algoriphilum]|uniref:hypothetical protein n=1 Tax=Clostridium algoriphilum TaxID=198347 RepID=UPI001CF4EE5E|nr:hypothetical protein [Clostridium algoriphilum]MCB2292666.1 hypothetical protein [Clostridium algoriphilum]
MMSNNELLVKMKNAANNSIANRKGLEIYYMGKMQAFMEAYSKDLADYYIYSDVYDHKEIFDGIRKGVLPPRYIKSEYN